MLSRLLHRREVMELNRGWYYWGRDDQFPPHGKAFRNWLILGGRGAGKTRAGAEWVKALALGIYAPLFRRCERIAIVAPTFDEARLVMIEGKSGLLAIHSAEDRPRYEPSKRTLTWPNGSVAQVFSAEDPMACADRNSMPPGAMNWRNGRRAVMHGPTCSSHCGWAMCRRP